MNMSASILRNLVEVVFPQVSSKNVILSGEISPTATFSGNTCWCPQTTQQEYSIFGFNPKLGFVMLEGLVSNSANRTDGTCDYTPGCELGEVEGVEKFVFFLVNDYVRTYDDDDEESHHSWTIYKAPNFAAHWAAITEADVRKWEEWLNA